MKAARSNTSASKLALCVVLLLAACGSGLQKQIVGKWEAQGTCGSMTHIVVTFESDGSSTFSIWGQTVRGTYKLMPPDSLEWHLNGKVSQHKVAVKGNGMELTGANGVTMMYVRL